MFQEATILERVPELGEVWIREVPLFCMEKLWGLERGDSSVLYCKTWGGLWEWFLCSVWQNLGGGGGGGSTTLHSEISSESRG